MQLNLTPKAVATVFGSCICILLLAHCLALFAHFYLGYPASTYAIELVKLDLENNLPTFFSGLQLFCCTLVLTHIAYYSKTQPASNYRHWAGLAIIFLFLCADELFMIHELFSKPTRYHLNATGVFHYAWIIPYGVFVAAVGSAYYPFVRKLPHLSRKRILLAGGVFVGGALGLEAAESYYYTATGEKDLLFAALTTLEEAMEMVGILMFLHALLQYAATHTKGPVMEFSYGSTGRTAKIAVGIRVDGQVQASSPASEPQLV